jgi:hypothetical protein
MDHPSQQGTTGEGQARARTFHRCRPGSRCGICRLLDEQASRERALFKIVLAQDEAFLAELERITQLFYDAVHA